MTPTPTASMTATPAGTPLDHACAHLTALFSPGDYATIRPTETWDADGRKASKVDYKGARSFLIGSKNGDGNWHSDPDRLRKNIVDAMKRTEVENTNLFLGVCPRVGGSGRFEKAWQIRKVPALWADVDDTDDVEVVLARCEKAGLPTPSIILHSGHGLHLYWLLNSPYLIDDVGDPEPVETESSKQGDKRKPRKYIKGEKGEKLYLDIPANKPELSPKAQHITDILQGLAVAIGGDHTFDLSRLLAMAGSLNRKNQRNGQEPILRRLLNCDPEQRYPIEAFEKFAEQSPTRQQREKINRIPLPQKNV